jgi:hypothetical protein
MSTTAAATANPNVGAVDPDEKVVEEVHCAECGVPMTAIPNWYATVRVKFTCDTCRTKSPRGVASAPVPVAPVVDTDSAVDVDLDTEEEDDAEDADVALDIEDEVEESED